MRGCDALVEMLIRYGIEYVFGVPGDTSVAFHDALRLRQDKIHHVLCRDERNAAYSADAYARVSGKIGVVEVPSGGGALYVVPGLSEANLSNIPLLCIASEINISSDETCALTDCNQGDLFAAVTKWNWKMKNSQSIPAMVRKAMRESLVGVRGATALSFPEDILRLEYAGKPEDLYAAPGVGDPDRYRGGVYEPDVDALLELLAAAEKPILLAGGGCHHSGAYEELARFVAGFGVPIVTSIDGKGSISEYDPLCLGTIGSNGASLEANEVAIAADLLIVLGCKMDNVTTIGKQVITPHKKIVQVDINEDIIGSVMRVDLPIYGDIKALLAACNKRLASWQPPRREEWLAQTKAQAEHKFARLADEYKREADQVISSRVFAAFDQYTTETSGDKTIFVGDAGTPTPYVSAHIRARKPGRKFVLPRSHGALGYAIGAAIGAQLAAPDHKVICLFGDASFGMAMSDIETIKRLQLPIVLVNFQNDCYGWIKTIQRLYYNEDYFGVDFSSVDGTKIAEGFGIKSRNVTRNDEIEHAVQWAVERNEPVFLNFEVEPITDYVPPNAQWEIDAAKDPKDRKKLVY